MKLLVRLLIAIGIVSLFLWWLIPGGGPDIESDSVLVIELGGEYVERARPSVFSRVLGDRGKPFVSLLTTFRKAERDDRIAGVVLHVRPLRVGWGKAEEIRDAIASLRAAGRKTAAFIEVESFAGNLEYFVASAADEVWTAPGTRAPLVGLAGEYLFLGGFFEKLGVELEVEKIGRYKTAADSFAGRTMTPAGREMANSILDSIDAQFVDGIAESRGVAPEIVRRAIDSAPFSPHEFEALGLIEGTAYRDEVAKKLASGPIVEPHEYAAVAPKSIGIEPAASFALVYGSGNVVSGRGRASPAGNPVLASQTVSKALLDAADDDDVSAIIFRIDSPGGSALASDMVWHATQRAREKGKPVIASFSDVAASGGYYVAAGADAIVSSPGTLTGSIGVFTIRFQLSGLLDHLGVGAVGLTRGQHADVLLAARPMSPGTRDRVRSEVRSVYDLFVERVSSGRALSPEAVDAVGRGRVWTGAQAAEIGLVDALGGLRAAVANGKEKLGLAPEDDVALIPYPKPRSLVEQIQESLMGLSIALRPELPMPPIASRAAAWLEGMPDGPVLLPPDHPGRALNVRFATGEESPMHLEKEFTVSAPREDAVASASRDETLLTLFADADTEIVESDANLRTTRSHYRALGREGVATFHFIFQDDGGIEFEKVCDGRVWRELSGTVSFEEKRGKTRVRIEMDGRTKGLVPEFTIKGPMQEQLDQMATALRRQIETGA